MRMKQQVVLVLFLFAAFLFLAPERSKGAAGSTDEKVEQLVAEAEEFLEQFRVQAGLEALDEAIQLSPTSSALHKKRGDVLMILRRNREALAAYRQAVVLDPDRVEGYWALGALLDRMSVDPEERLMPLIHIARVDSGNPLAQLRVGRKLREMDRFEDSLESFRRAVELEPNHLVYRLLLGRALFDVLDYRAARQEVEWVLSHASPGSSEWVAAWNLTQTVEGGTMDRGARSDFFETTKRAYGKEGKDYKAWAMARGQSWQLMNAGKYAEAEAVLHKVLELDPDDDLARYNLGLTLMELGRYESARVWLKESFRESKHPHFYPNAVFQIGRALAKLGRWEEAVSNYERVLEIEDWKDRDFYSLNFPDLTKVRAALETARQHVPNPTLLSRSGRRPTPPSHTDDFSEGSNPSLPNLTSPQSFTGESKTPARVVPLDVNVVRGWFRILITAKAVVRDDLQAGFHDYMPLCPGDTFPPHQPEIYLIFGMTTPPTGDVKVTSHWIAEQVDQLPPNTVVGTDVVLMGLNEATGYFYLERPEGGWPVGTYRIDLFAGDEVSAYTYIADVRFRIVSSPH